MIAPSGEAFFKAFTTDKCSSDVPGGVSATSDQINHFSINFQLNSDNELIPLGKKDVEGGEYDKQLTEPLNISMGHCLGHSLIDHTPNF